MGCPGNQRPIRVINVPLHQGLLWVVGSNVPLHFKKKKKKEKMKSNHPPCSFISLTYQDLLYSSFSCLF